MRDTSCVFWVGWLATFACAWLIFRVVVRRDYRENGSLSPLSTALEFLIFGIHANLPYLYLSVPWPALPGLPASALQRILGGSILASGLLATLGIMAWLGFRTTVGSQPDLLEQNGPYRWSRNPQLLTYGLGLVGILILYPSWRGAAWVALYGAIAQVMILTEEEHLLGLFGPAYERYCQQVPRYLPRIGMKGTLPLEKED